MPSLLKLVSSFVFVVQVIGFGAVNELDYQLRSGLDHLRNFSGASVHRSAMRLLRDKHNGSIIDSHDWIVITSVNPPTRQMKTLCSVEGWNKVVVGDLKTPANWHAPGCMA